MKSLLKVLAGLLALVLVVLVGGWLALQRPDIPYETLEAKYGGGASQYVELPGGVRAHYRDQGRRDGPVLVMVHGFSASLNTWEPWVKALGGDYRIVTIDLPGHGLTRAPEGYAPTIEGFADHVDAVTAKLGLTKFTLIGNSMGGNTAWVYALRHPQKLDGLVLVDASGWPETREDAKKEPAVFKVLASPVGRAVLGKLDASAMTRDGLRAAFAPTPDMVDDAMVARYVEMARAPGHRDVILGLMTGFKDRPIASNETLAPIKVPVLIMQGDTDRLVPPDHGRKFAAAIPGSTLIMYEKTGHIPMEQIAAKSAADLKGWLEARVYPAKPTP